MAENLKGLKFGRLMPFERGKNDKSGHVRWWCECECGNTILASAGHYQIIQERQQYIKKIRMDK